MNRVELLVYDAAGSGLQYSDDRIIHVFLDETPTSMRVTVKDFVYDIPYGTGLEFVTDFTASYEKAFRSPGVPLRDNPYKDAPVLDLLYPEFKFDYIGGDDYVEVYRIVGTDVLLPLNSPLTWSLNFSGPHVMLLMANQLIRLTNLRGDLDKSLQGLLIRDLRALVDTYQRLEELDPPFLSSYEEPDTVVQLLQQVEKLGYVYRLERGGDGVEILLSRAEAAQPWERFWNRGGVLMYDNTYGMGPAAERVAEAGAVGTVSVRVVPAILSPEGPRLLYVDTVYDDGGFAVVRPEKEPLDEAKKVTHFFILWTQEVKGYVEHRGCLGIRVGDVDRLSQLMKAREPYSESWNFGQYKRADGQALADISNAISVFTYDWMGIGEARTQKPIGTVGIDTDGGRVTDTKELRAVQRAGYRYSLSLSAHDSGTEYDMAVRVE